MLQIEFEFILPQGYLDREGDVHRQGKMRLATALDEITAVRDPRVAANEAYLTILMLSRVITGLGTLSEINPGVIEGLFSADLAYLEAFYQRINEGHSVSLERVICPHCQHDFEREALPLGG